MIKAYAVKKKGLYVNQIRDTTYSNDTLAECFVFNTLDRAQEIARKLGGRVIIVTVFEEDYLLATANVRPRTPLRDVFGIETPLEKKAGRLIE